MLRSSITFSRTALPAVACVVLVLAPAEGAKPAAADENVLLQSLLFSEASEFSTGKLQRTDRDGVTEWKVSGHVTAKGLGRLATLNTREGIATVFHEAAKSADKGDFKSADGRLLVVNTRTLENPAYKSGASGDAGYPFTFELVITRRPASSK